MLKLQVTRKIYSIVEFLALARVLWAESLFFSVDARLELEALPTLLLSEVSTVSSLMI